MSKLYEITGKLYGIGSYAEYPDAESITNKDAVSMLTTLGILEGRPDGSFDPEGEITRAEVCKVVYFMLSKGANAEALYAGLDTPKLGDIENNWAKPYIKYCYVNGIVAGYGNGKFEPTKNITAAELAKVLLVAAGYEADKEGFTGKNWSLNVAKMASTLGIFDNFNASISEKINRDNASLLFYNALDIEMIERYDGVYARPYSDRRTILSDCYGVYKVTGVVVANEYAELNQTNTDAALGINKTTMTDVVVYDSNTISTVPGPSGTPVKGPVTFNVTTDENVLGESVTLYIRKDRVLENSVVLGYYANEPVTPYTKTADTLKDLLKDEGLGDLKITTGTEFYVNYGYRTNQNDAETIISMPFSANARKFNYRGVKVKVIDNDGDSNIDYVLYKLETLSEITSNNSTTEKLAMYALQTYQNSTRIPQKNAHSDQNLTVDFDDVVGEDGFKVEDAKVEDLVLYTQYGGRTYLRTPVTVTGRIDKITRDKNDELYITLDSDRTYYQSYIGNEAYQIDYDVIEFDITKAHSELGYTAQYEFVLDSSNNIIARMRDLASEPQYALVIDSAYTKNGLTPGGDIQVVLSNGTKPVYKLNYQGSLDSKAFANEDDLRNYLGSEDVHNTTGNYTTGAAKGSIIEYTVAQNSKGEDELTIKNVLKLNRLEAFTDETDANKKGYIDNYDENSKEADKTGNSNYVYPAVGNVPAGGNKYAGGKRIFYIQDCAQWRLTKEYNTGDPRVRLVTKLFTSIPDKATGSTTNYKGGDLATYAVDDNTIAFYYNDKTGDSTAAVGKNNMLKVSNNTEVQVYAVERKVAEPVPAHEEAIRLAKIVVFRGYDATTTYKDYMFVLSRNITSGSGLSLNVVFEDGSVQTITATNDVSEFEAIVGDAFYVAYPYIKTADGKYTLDIKGRVTANDTVRMLDGTVDSDGWYYALNSNSAVWYVQGLNTESSKAPAMEFSTNVHVRAVIVPPNGDVLRTAWVWDRPTEGSSTTTYGNDSVTITWDDSSNGTIEVDKCDGSSMTTEQLIRQKLGDAGYEVTMVDSGYVRAKAPNDAVINLKIEEHTLYKVTLEIGAGVKVMLGDEVLTNNSVIYTGSKISGKDCSGVKILKVITDGKTVSAVGSTGVTVHNNGTDTLNNGETFSVRATSNGKLTLALTTP